MPSASAPPPGPFHDTIAALHADVSRETGRLHVLHEARTVCREGCSACCVDDLTVFAVEANEVRREHALLLAEGVPHAVGGCAFLDERGACRIYRTRPQVCRTQGLPLRWTEEGEEGVVELRDICPLNEPLNEPLNQKAESIVDLPAGDCWTIGPVEERLARLEIAGSVPAARVRLRDLFRSST